MPNYAFGKIYKIVNSINKKVYIGSTCQRFLATRMGGHRRDSKNDKRELYCDMRRLGFDKFRMILIINYPCTSKAELEAKEYEVLNELIENKIPVYNMIVNCKHAEATKKTLSNILKKEAVCILVKTNNAGCLVIDYQEEGNEVNIMFLDLGMTKQNDWLANSNVITTQILL